MDYYILANRPALRGTRKHRCSAVHPHQRNVLHFKNPLKFSHIFPHFQLLDDFISRVFIDIVFCRYSASNEVFDLRAFLFQIHSSFLKMADNKTQKRLTAYDPSWEKDFPIGPASQNKHSFYCHPS